MELQVWLLIPRPLVARPSLALRGVTRKRATSKSASEGLRFPSLALRAGEFILSILFILSPFHSILIRRFVVLKSVFVSVGFLRERVLSLPQKGTYGKPLISRVVDGLPIAITRHN